MSTHLCSTFADVARLVRLERSFPPRLRYDEADFKSYLRRRHRFDTLILTEAGAGVGAPAGADLGYVIIDRKGGSDADAIYVESVCVARGRRRQGIGRRLMALVEARYDEAIELQSRPGFDAFYRRLGYLEVPDRREGKAGFYRKEGRLWLRAYEAERGAFKAAA